MLKKPVGNALLLGLVVVLGCNRMEYADDPPVETTAPPLASVLRPPAPQPQPQPVQQAQRLVPIPTEPPTGETLVAVAAPPWRQSTSAASESPIRITSATAAPERKEAATPPADPAPPPAEPIIPPPTEPQPALAPEEQVPTAMQGRQPQGSPEADVVGVTCQGNPSGRLLCPSRKTLVQGRPDDTGPDLTPPEAVPGPLPRPLAGMPVPPVVHTANVGEEASELTQASYLAPAAEASKLEVRPAHATEALPPPAGAPDPAPAAPLKEGFGFARDYSWLMGELQYVRSRDVWRLRYAEAEQDERYGGTVTLVGEGLTADCKTGQIVRVEGQMINPDSTDPRPPYWAKKLRILKAPLDSEE
jgi:hypothetical protein